MPMIDTFSLVLPNAFFGIRSGPASLSSTGADHAAAPARTDAPASPAAWPRNSRRSAPSVPAVFSCCSFMTSPWCVASFLRRRAAHHPPEDLLDLFVLRVERKVMRQPGLRVVELERQPAGPA